MNEKQQRRLAKRLAKGPEGPWQELDVELIVTQPFAAKWRVNRAFRTNHRYVYWAERQTSWGPVIHLAIGRFYWPRKPQGFRWTELQQIKDTIAGPDRVAVEVYPPTEDVVDEAPMAHLWVLPPEFSLPFGLHLPAEGPTHTKRTGGRA